jgi:hypothetical protein
LILSDLDLPSASGSVHWHIPSGRTSGGCGAAAWVLTRRTKTNHSRAPRGPACDPRAVTMPGRCTSKGQAATCPDRTQAIPCKVQQSPSEDRSRARWVPDRPGNPGISRSRKGQPAARADLRLGSLRQRRSRPPKQQVPRSSRGRGAGQMVKIRSYFRRYEMPQRVGRNGSAVQLRSPKPRSWSLMNCSAKSISGCNVAWSAPDQWPRTSPMRYVAPATLRDKRIFRNRRKQFQNAAD